MNHYFCKIHLFEQFVIYSQCIRKTFRARVNPAENFSRRTKIAGGKSPRSQKRESLVQVFRRESRVSSDMSASRKDREKREDGRLNRRGTCSVVDNSASQSPRRVAG